MRKKPEIDATILAGIILVSAFSLLLYTGITVPQDYLKDVRIPGIVEGSAKMVDTEKYFTRNILETAIVEIDITCNNSDHLELSVGYKTPYVSLMDISEVEKEVKLWAGRELYPAKNIVDKATTITETEKTQITKRWDLLEATFTMEDYVKADERIWYLKIRDTSDDSYGYEKNVTEVVNGTTIVQTEFIPKINFLNTFELCFNDIHFKTLLHPCFDGSTEIIVPIRGVNHELVFEEDTENNLYYNRGDSIQTIRSNSLPLNQLAVVFATGYYLEGEEHTSWAPYGAHLFLMGQYPNPPREADDLPYGIYDYGWNILYCIGRVENQLYDVPTKTCDYTDDDFLDYLLQIADDLCAFNSKLIVFTHGHGKLVNLQHATLSSQTTGYSDDVMKCSEYKDHIKDITDDDTHVFLWVGCCKGSGLGSWLSNQHHNKLEVWYYKPVVYGLAIYYYDLHYLYWHCKASSGFDTEGNLFFINAMETNPKHITPLGIELDENFEFVRPTSDDMFTKTYWGSFQFYI